ncbi:GGDEF domain-containing protein [Lacticigenium naphthae]|uniref:GGDEF domain-containing protein n=1 Tax=Lacticigenium naphthae TaxID=515351 RepID=UPI00041760A3|nr:sensor domain-containing diguanylate cyclase [Lacticigenium naphthae]
MSEDVQKLENEKLVLEESLSILKEKLEELTLLNKELLSEREADVNLEYSWSGNLGHWYWNVKTNSVVFNLKKITTLGYSLDEVPEKIPYDFFTNKLHPEDHEPTMNNMREHLKGERAVYEVEYRIKAKNGKYKWFYDRGKVTQRDQEGRPLFLSGIVFDITEQKQKEKKLNSELIRVKQQASIDDLTRIKSRRAILSELDERMLEAGLYKKPLVVAMFDIDLFKNLNDQFGHLAGDDVLRSIARVMNKNFRAIDSIGRYGGEEFIAILPYTTIEEAGKITNRIREKIAETKFIADYPVTISGGIALFDGDSREEFIQRADASLYKAKNEGRNRVVSE